MIHADCTSDSQQPRGEGFWWTVLLSSAALAAALWGSWQRPVWHDELYTLYLARMPVADLIEALRLDSGPPLHYLLCHLLYLLVGWHEGSNLGTFMVRLPSVLAFTALPWVVRRWACLQGSRGWWAPLLIVVWLPMLYFATEARAYALLALVNAFVWLWGRDLIRSGGIRVAGFAALAASLPMLHYAGIVSLCALPLLACVIPRSRWRAFAAALGAASMPLLAWTPMLLNAPRQSMGWVDTLSGPGRPGLATIQVISPAGPFPALFEPPPAIVSSWVSLIALLLMAGGCLLGAADLCRRRSNLGAESPSLFVPAVGLLPVLGLALLAVFGLPVYFAGRSESMVWPLAAVLAAALLRTLPRKLRLLAVGPYIALALGTTTTWLIELPSRPASIGVEIGRALAPQLRPDDMVVVLGLWQLEVEHGLAEEALAGGDASSKLTKLYVVPGSQADHPGWMDRAVATSSKVADEFQALERSARQRGNRVWLVSSPGLKPELAVGPAFSGWQFARIVQSPVVAVDLMLPPRVRAEQQR
jgi:hypothetical protein